MHADMEYHLRRGAIGFINLIVEVVFRATLAQITQDDFHTFDEPLTLPYTHDAVAMPSLYE